MGAARDRGSPAGQRAAARSDARLPLLIEVVDEVQSARTVDDLALIIRGAARRLSGADGVSIVLRDGDPCHYADEGEVELNYAPEGLTCEVVFPLE